MRLSLAYRLAAVACFAWPGVFAHPARAEFHYVRSISFPPHSPTAVALDASHNVYLAIDDLPPVHSASVDNPRGAYVYTSDGSSSRYVGFAEAPHGVAVAPDGSVYVSDDFGEFVYRYTNSGALAAIINSDVRNSIPTERFLSIASDAGGNLLLTSQNGHVGWFSPSGTLLDQFAAPLSPSEAVTAIATTPGNSGLVFLSVYDTSAPSDPGRVLICYTDGTIYAQFEAPASGGVPSQLQGLGGLAVDEQFRIYISNTANHRIEVYAPTGELLTQFGTFGTGPGQISYPQRLAVDAAGTSVWVTDSLNRVQLFLIPEPATALLLVVGATGLAIFARLQSRRRT